MRFLLLFASFALAQGAATISQQHAKFGPKLTKIKTTVTVNANFGDLSADLKIYIYSAKQRHVASPSRCNFSKFQIS